MMKQGKKEKVLTNAYKLKDSRSDILKNIRLAHDMTNNEKEKLTENLGRRKRRKMRKKKSRETTMWHGDSPGNNIF